MAQQKNFLAFDCGATSGRAVLATFSSDGFKMEEVYRFPNQVLQIGDKFYWNVYSIYEHFIACLKQLRKDGIRIDSIGIDTWGVDFGCVASDGTLLGLPRAYRDPYTEGIPEKVFAIVPREELYARTGIQIMNFNSIFQLFAQKEECGAAYSNASSILFMPDLLSWLLTGKEVCEYTEASTSGMIDPRTRDFDRDLLSRLGIDPAKLGKLVQPGTVVGPLREEIARETGLGPVPVIAVAGHDTASAVAAIPAADEKFAFLSSGTWSLMGIESPVPVLSERSCELNFTNEGGIDGTTRFLKNITGMWLLEQCRKVWAAEGRTYNYAQIEAMARDNFSFTATVDPDDPRLANPADMQAAICGILTENGKPVPANDGEMISCIYHSLAVKYRSTIALLQEFAPFKIEKLHVIGGGSANATVSQLTADTIGMPVIAGPTEATAIGNIMVQAQTAGLVKDRWDMRRYIADAFKVKTYYPNK